MKLQQNKMPKKKILCPVCSSKLVLKQINLDTAVYLCLKSECVYPQGHDWIMVTRSLSEMYDDNQRKLKRRRILNVDKFLDTITGEPINPTGNDTMGDASLMDCDIMNQTELCNEFNFDDMMDEWASKPTSSDQVDTNGIEFDFNEFMQDFPATNVEPLPQPNGNSKKADDVPKWDDDSRIKRRQSDSPKKATVVRRDADFNTAVFDLRCRRVFVCGLRG
ncbi:PREDICTED: uncharacterized protein LOC108562425 isoform X2 [Nicrophorus vespilloides]|uniref:Uncharacterized protein LOC108557797 isoform X2 n=1 Tax=Nicrophorus vespilloides TaxID=110193 RepID=A0ABM1M5U8_NICVS|nr:PREDICTED: uncharacterized protein LOC108557797 isoform X2 [Nicrophorus vespilloides]XP_017776240.1 PREDICTED: uncharacterized protein LOC108562425 isoform X2 [Nicrophorus vespilloides]